MSAARVAAYSTLITLSACAGNHGAEPRPSVTHETAGHVAQSPAAPTHDSWRALIQVPFGSTVQQIGFPLREVILFQSQSKSTGEGDSQECYARTGELPTFKGATPEDTELCFFHERLFRVEAALRLPKEAESASFEHWCADWLTGLQEVEKSADVCEGREHDLGFAARRSAANEGAKFDDGAQEKGGGKDSDETAAGGGASAGMLITVNVYDAALRAEYEDHVQQRAPSLPSEEKPAD